MLTDRNIAFFIDIDGLRIKTENYQSAIDQLQGMGTILHGKLYGCGERKHKAICKEAELKGYKMERAKRIKRRGRKEFDNRIFVDVVDTVCTTPAVDAVCIASPSCDMVYLYSYLRAKGIKIIALDNVDEAGKAFIDEFLDIGVELETPKERVYKQRAAEPRTTNNDLLREIESLKAIVADQTPQETVIREVVREVPVQQEEQQEPVIEEVAEEPAAEAVEEEPEQEAVDEAKELLEKYYAVASGEEQAEATEEEMAEEIIEEEVIDEETGEVKVVRRKVAYAPHNDSDLIRKIEEIRKGGQSDVPEDLAEHIKKILEGIE